MPILIVDDSEPHRYALGRMLEQAGYAVVLSDSVTTASSLAKSAHPSLILLDINLPDGSGFDLFRALRSDPATAAIPIVFFSAQETASVQTEVQNLGADGFLTYPIDQKHLVAVIEGATARRPPKRLSDRVFPKRD